MIRTILELGWQMVTMVSVGAAVGSVLNGALGEACFRLVIAAVAAFWWRQFRALERD